MMAGTALKRLMAEYRHYPLSPPKMRFTCDMFHPNKPNDESGANVDASKMWREDRQQFYSLAQNIVRKSLGL
ncbi:hypothetical protein F7725_002727 [Dissostichus mawsoni]|uniref:Uncharacterized protein n=1 Tax=Dissostichus mawsoni TaxID=36200 RepID=A0A7J5Y6C7_DISMA|nr:hypothetical protein F7725_002727 [Dissostichus mawsoni]